MSNAKARLAAKLVPTIHLVRHGQTALNSERSDQDRIRGWNNVPLTPQGHDEANRVGRQLRGQPIEKIYTSDLGRAHDTALHVAAHTGAPVEATAGLRPWNLGHLQGQTHQATAAPIQAAIAAPDHPIPGGESFNAFKTRFLTELGRILANHPKGHIAVVTHHRGDRLIDSWVRGAMSHGHIDASALHEKGMAPGTVRRIEVPHGKTP